MACSLCGSEHLIRMNTSGHQDLSFCVKALAEKLNPATLLDSLEKAAHEKMEAEDAKATAALRAATDPGDATPAATPPAVDVAPVATSAAVPVTQTAESSGPAAV